MRSWERANGTRFETLAGRAAAAVGSAIALAILASVARGGPTSFAIALLGLAGVSAINPRNGFLIVCGLFPLSTLIDALWAVPGPAGLVAESMVLAFLAGWLLSEAIARRSHPRPPVLASALLMILITAASAAVVVLGLRPTVPGPFEWERLGSFVRESYAHSSTGRPIEAACQLIAGMLLVIAARRNIQSEADQRRAIRLILIGITAAAAMNITRFLQVVLARADAVAAARELLRWVRINVHYPDVNAAGSVFAMAFVASLGWIIERRGLERGFWIGCSLLLAGALWLAGSRTAIASVVLVVAGASSVLLAGRFRAGKGRWVLLGASAVAAAVVTAGVLLQFPRTQANTDPGSAWSIRLEMFRRAARMAAESPVFGIGIGRFYLESSRFASPSSFGPENAHNDLLQVLAEQGAIGLIVLLWMLSTVLMAILQQWRTGHSYCCLSTLAGLTAFLLSGLGGHPLIVLQSAILFWLLLGASTSRAGAGTHPKIRTAVAVVAALVLLSVPFRIMAHRETLQLDATHVAAWDHDGTRGYIKAGPNFVTYLTRQIATLTIPVRLAGPSGSADLAILLRDRLVNRVRVSTDEWYELRLQIPRGSGYEDLRLELRLDESRRDVELLVGEMSFGVRD